MKSLRGLMGFWSLTCFSVLLLEQYRKGTAQSSVLLLEQYELAGRTVAGTIRDSAAAGAVREGSALVLLLEQYE